MMCNSVPKKSSISKELMEWNIYYYNMSQKRLWISNIFLHSCFAEEVRYTLNHSDNKKQFAEKIRASLFYYFKSRAEWEVLIKSWLGDDEIKIDVYDQVIVNWDRFVDYVWSFKPQPSHEQKG